MFFRSVGDMVERNRKVRSDKKVRVNASLDADTHEKLRALALACSDHVHITKTSMAAILLKIAVNQQDIVNHVQNLYQADRYRVIPARINDRVKYVVPRNDL